MALETVPITPHIGAIVWDIDLSAAMADDRMPALVDLLFDRGVLIIPNQLLSDGDYVRFAHFFGRPLDFFIPEHRNSEFPAIIRIDNDPDTPQAARDGAAHWHSDSSYETEPGAATMLYGKAAPTTGGETHFASTAAAYADLPDVLKEELDGLIARHDLGRAPWIEGETLPDPDRPVRKTDAPTHPLIMVHPVTGRKAIFTSGTAYAIDGMGPNEATALIRALREHIVQPQYRMTYKIMPGDIVLWDNFGTVHCASPIEYSNEAAKRRLLYRISTKGIPAHRAQAG